MTFATLCCIALATHSQTLQVTANWGSFTGITTTGTSYGINADRTDPRIVGYPGNAAYNDQLSRLGFQYLRIWGGQYADSTKPGGWRFHENRTDEGWDAEKIKDTLRNYASYGPKHIMLEIGGWPAWMNEPGSNPEKPRLDPSHYGDFAKYCADLVRIVNKEDPGGRRIDMFELPNEKEDGYQGPGDGLIMGHFFTQAAAAMKAVDPTIEVGGPAYSWALQWETKNFISAAGNSLDFISWHEYATGESTTPTTVIWQNGNQGRANQIVVAMNTLLVQTLGHPLPMYVDEYAVNYACWEHPDARCANAVEAVYDGLKIISYLRAGVTGTAKWNVVEDAYGVMDGHEGKFSYRPAAYVFAVLNHSFIGREVATTTTDGAKVVPFAVQVSERKGALLLVHSVENIPENVVLDLQNFQNAPRKIVVNTITDSGLSTSTMRFSKTLTLTLPPSSVTALIFDKKAGKLDLK